MYECKHVAYGYEPFDGTKTLQDSAVRSRQVWAETLSGGKTAYIKMMPIMEKGVEHALNLM